MYASVALPKPLAITVAALFKSISRKFSPRKSVTLFFWTINLA